MLEAAREGNKAISGAQKRTPRFLAITFNFTLNYADFCIKSH